MTRTTAPALTALRVKYVQMVKERQRLEADILNPQPMRVGSLSSLLMQCGKENCVCKDKRNPKKHGPYDYWRKLSAVATVKEIAGIRRLSASGQVLKDAGLMARLGFTMTRGKEGSDRGGRTQAVPEAT